MNETEAIFYVLDGAGHPGNCFRGSPFLEKDPKIVTAFVEAIPPEWRRFRTLIVDYYLPKHGFPQPLHR